MVAAILHLDIGAVAAETVDQMAGGLAHRHDVVDLHLLGRADQVGDGQALPGVGLHLLVEGDGQHQHDQ